MDTFRDWKKFKRKWGGLGESVGGLGESGEVWE